jgi:hypothetical protein
MLVLHQKWESRVRKKGVAFLLFFCVVVKENWKVAHACIWPVMQDRTRKPQINLATWSVMLCISATDEYYRTVVLPPIQGTRHFYFTCFYFTKKYFKYMKIIRIKLTSLENVF